MNIPLQGVVLVVCSHSFVKYALVAIFLFIFLWKMTSNNMKPLHSLSLFWWLSFMNKMYSAYKFLFQPIWPRNESLSLCLTVINVFHLFSFLLLFSTSIDPDSTTYIIKMWRAYFSLDNWEHSRKPFFEFHSLSFNKHSAGMSGQPLVHTLARKGKSTSAAEERRGEDTGGSAFQAGPLSFSPPMDAQLGQS